MPEWKDRWGEWLVQGFRLVVAALVWSLPAIIVGSAGGHYSGDNDRQRQQLVPIAIGGLGIVCLLAWSCSGRLSWCWLYRASRSGLRRQEDRGAGLAFGDILAFTRQHLSSVIVVSIVYIIAAFVVSIVGGVIGVLLCGIGLFVTVPLATLITYLIQAHLYAQVGRDALGFAVEPVAATAISPAPSRRR